jgi:hypothetical protein
MIISGELKPVDFEIRLPYDHDHYDPLVWMTRFSGIYAIFITYTQSQKVIKQNNFKHVAVGSK